MRFSTKLDLGQKVFVVDGSLDPIKREVTVGQVRVIETHPAYYRSCGWKHDAVYKEEYMCVETGVGSGRIYHYGWDIFATEVEADRGLEAAKQRCYLQRKERDENMAKWKAQQEAEDRRRLAELKAKYESQEPAVHTD